jgi:nitrite reductase (NO-forming)
VISASEGDGATRSDEPVESQVTVDADAAKGKLTFETKCAACHSVGNGDKIGPDLNGVTKRHSDKWLTSWLLTTEKMQNSDPAAKELLAKYKVPMPNPGLNRSEVRQIVKYFSWNDQKDRH